ncbi:MAG: flagellar hook assembly protein FlgD [Hylemonella sp.]
MLSLLNDSNNLNNAAAVVNASNGQASKAPAGIMTTASAAMSKLTSTAGTAGSMGEKDFLLLFTTQLKNQNPLDPVKNEAFVAQLAQFSQLQATTTMSDTLKSYVDSMAGQQMLNSANLIGKQVLVPNAPGAWNGSTPISGSFSLPQGADAVQLEVLDSTGNIVNSQSYGPQSIGDIPFAWSGVDAAGNTAPKGYYTFRATVFNKGASSSAPLSVYATVNSVNQSADKSINLNVAGGKSIKLTDVTRIGG